MKRRNVFNLGAIVLGLALLPGGAVAQQKSLKDQLVGTWIVESWEQVRPDGSKFHRFGANPKGIQIFDATGRFAIMFLAPDLPKIASNNPSTPSPEELKALTGRSIAYYGTYSVVDENAKIIVAQFVKKYEPVRKGLGEILDNRCPGPKPDDEGNVADLSPDEAKKCLGFLNDVRDGKAKELTGERGKLLKPVVEGAFDDREILKNLEYLKIIRNEQDRLKGFKHPIKGSPLAIGARLKITAGGVSQVSEIRSGDSYLSQSDFRQHFGLAKAAKVDSVEIRWPSGKVETIKDLAANKRYAIKEDSGVVDAERAVIQVNNYLAATSQLAQTTLRWVLGKHDLDAMLAERDKLNADIQDVLDKQTEGWGIKVSNVEIKRIDLDESMVRAIARQAEAERTRRAKIINAEGEQQAAQKLVDAARVLAPVPQAMQLRYLATLFDIAGERSSTIVFPFPLDILELWTGRTPRG